MPMVLNYGLSIIMGKETTEDFNVPRTVYQFLNNFIFNVHILIRLLVCVLYNAPYVVYR